ncbi:uncharacterized protein I206_101092 [Kwoniella pini CBS 10737]|uniref:Myotubularin phosphatase domain-containing protein n=1 Tax=Kwoniella pini CBS 10737 TaxID=1296096 RepID=A0A1B9IBV1_9TREE|nr:uncharacterized protein I206_00235 [Kwoniella pini CBS 10737]OCF52934.1 hypothetical protein I206_00235 [Kwoniella pini CBS 10737]
MDTIKVARVDNVVLEHYIAPTEKNGQPSKVRKTGTIHLTPHHLIFHQNSSSSSSSNNQSSQSSSSASPDQNLSGKDDDKEEIWIPYPSITLLTKLPQSIQGYYPLRIETKYFQNYVFLFEKDQDNKTNFNSINEKEKGKGKFRGGSEDVWQSIKDSAIKNSVEQLHAFFYNHSISSSSLSSSNANSNGWSIYNPKNEFTRQGLGSKTKSWRFTDINKDYSFSSTYPNKLIIPTKISDSTLSYACKYRSKSRIPVLSYLHWANNASITRSSQPMVGLKNSRSAQDERLVECIFSTHHYPDTAFGTPIYGATTTNLIIDARPTTNAMANVAMGAGTENMENYKMAKKAYLGIDNIHVMRNSLKIISEAIREAEMKPSAILDRGLLRKSNWLKHISTILDGSLIIIKNIHLNASHVLIHCSDGWDRTGQLSAISQICLDPYYRTIEGFSVLIEKDFLSFGHKFMDRSNHLSSEKYFIQSTENDIDSDEDYNEKDEFNVNVAGIAATKAAQAFFQSVSNKFNNSSNLNSSNLKEISPVFHQFLDCIYQILKQFSNRFEFNEFFLLDIFYHLYSCQFGTFLFNNEKQKTKYINQTTSLWDYISLNKMKYINKEYDFNLNKIDSDQGVLLFDPKEVKFWFKLFKRGDEEMNGSSSQSSTSFLNQNQNQNQGINSNGIIQNSSQDPVIKIISPLQQNSNNNNDNNLLLKRTISPSNSTTSSSSSWNWQQFSNGALNVVSQASKQIKNISTDAYNQIKAEAGEVDTDPWKKQAQTHQSNEVTGENQSNVIVENKNEYNSYIPKTGFRIPSETNPWSNTKDIPNDTNHSIKPQTCRLNSNPWSTDRYVESTPIIAPVIRNEDDEKTHSTSLAGLSLNEQNYPSHKTIPTTLPIKSSEIDESEEMIRAAMGDDKKAWDPLGAL